MVSSTTIPRATEATITVPVLRVIPDHPIIPMMKIIGNKLGIMLNPPYFTDQKAINKTPITDKNAKEKPLIWLSRRYLVIKL